MGYNKHVRDLFREYEAAGNPMPADLNDVADWALRSGKWAPAPELARRKLVEDLGRALREEYFTDEEGNRIRAKHPAVVKRGGAQHHLWQDARTASHTHMTAAFAGRRNGVVGDLTQLKRDVDWYNRYHADRPNVQLILNFNDDIAEIEAAQTKAKLMYRDLEPRKAAEGKKSDAA